MAEAFVMPNRPVSRRILDNQIIKDEFARNLWIVRPEHGITREDMLQPKFWTNVLSKLRTGDRIECLSEDGTWFLEMIVRGANAKDISLGELNYVEFDAVAARNSDDYEVKWVSPTIKYRIIRRADGVIMKEGLGSKEAVEAWLVEPMIEKAA